MAINPQLPMPGQLPAGSTGTNIANPFLGAAGLPADPISAAYAQMQLASGQGQLGSGQGQLGAGGPRNLGTVHHTPARPQGLTAGAGLTPSQFGGPTGLPAASGTTTARSVYGNLPYQQGASRTAGNTWTRTGLPMPMGAGGAGGAGGGGGRGSGGGGGRGSGGGGARPGAAGAPRNVPGGPGVVGSASHRAAQQATAAAPGGMFGWQKGVGLGRNLRTAAGPAALRIGAPMAVNMLGQAGINHFMPDENQESWYDEFAKGALTGGSFGAMTGNPLIAGVAALGGGTYNAVFGRTEPAHKQVAKALEDTTKRADTALDALDAPPELRQQIRQQLNAYAAMAENKEQYTALTAEILGGIPMQVEHANQTRQQEAFAAANQAAVQSWLGPMMQQVIDRQNFYADMQANLLGSSAAQFDDPAMQAAAQALANQIPGDVAQGQLGHLTQLGATPSLYGWDTGIGQNGAANMDLASITGATPTPQNPAYVQWLAAQMAQQQGTGGQADADLAALMGG